MQNLPPGTLQRKVPFENPKLKPFSKEWLKQKTQKPFVWSQHTIYKVITDDGAKHIVVWTGTHILWAGSFENKLIMPGPNWPKDIKITTSLIKSLLK